MMQSWFWDSSALVKLYFEELGSAQTRDWLTDKTHRHWITGITRAEISSAIVRRLTPAVARQYTAQLDSDVLEFHIVRTDDDLIARAVGLVRRHRLRGCDGLQLAAAMMLVPASTGSGMADVCVFVSADDVLNTAAAAEGMQVRNPGG